MAVEPGVRPSASNRLRMAGQSPTRSMRMVEPAGAMLRDITAEAAVVA
ncbi:hypothetical protein [Megalodesulfovibrio paquesii]